MVVGVNAPNSCVCGCESVSTFLSIVVSTTVVESSCTCPSCTCPSTVNSLELMYCWFAFKSLQFGQRAPVAQ